MEIGLIKIHVGKAIEERRIELEISKSEFGRRIGVSQQHVNRILERDTMETNKLVVVSEALNFNFFSLFCSDKVLMNTQNVRARISAVSMRGNAYCNNKYDPEEIRKKEEELGQKNEKIKELQEEVADLKGLLTGKDAQISALKERNEEQKSLVDSVKEDYKYQFENFKYQIEFLKQQLQRQEAELKEKNTIIEQLTRKESLWSKTKILAQ